MDGALPVVTLVRPDGSILAALVSYACHPVVLGADNLLLTADYPGVVRTEIERLTGATTLFATGCAGDVNTGHSADPTVSLPVSAQRTFDECALLGARIAHAALGAELTPAAGSTDWGSRTVTLDLDVATPEQRRAEAELWGARARASDLPGTAALFEAWERWARSVPANAPRAWEAQVDVLRWGTVVVVTLPGEPFATVGTRIRHELQTSADVVIVLGYCNGSPGYLPTAEEYELGGYEVCDAHRYYGMPGPFRGGSAERLISSALAVASGMDLGPRPRRPGAVRHLDTAPRAVAPAGDGESARAR